jgi:tripartite-type tricarboxylate transporter receptor subunit TctC
MTISRRQFMAAVAGSTAAPLMSQAAFAQQAYPTGPVRVVIPFPPGGPTDALGRIICQRMADSLGQPFIVDNRAGASGMIGANMVAQAPPDGQTLLINVSAHVINPSLYANLRHDPLKAFVPVTALATTPIQLVVASNLPVNTVEELIAYLKAKHGTCTFASSSNGTAGHLAGELFRMATKTDAVHVPYKGSAPALLDVAGGRVTYMFDSMPSSLSLVKGGKLKALAITGTSRSKSLPQVPTLVEKGFAEMTLTTWYGMWAPAGTPPDVVNRLQDEVVKALARNDVKARLEELSSEGIGDSPTKFASFCRAEAERYAHIIKTAGIKLE